MPYNKRRRYKEPFVFLPFLVIIVVLVIGGVVMLLWNAILPSVAHVGRLSYGQAVGLLVLCRILFGSFRPGPSSGIRERRRRWKEKWSNMTEDERMQFREQLRQRCRPKRNDDQQNSNPQ